MLQDEFNHQGRFEDPQEALYHIFYAGALMLAQGCAAIIVGWLLIGF
jgi:hypothetical protein